jgi:hypothetical protein
MQPPVTDLPSDPRDPTARPAGIGRRRFIQGATAATAATALVGGWAGEAHAAVAPGASQFVPLAEVTRVLDTRTTDHPYTRFDPTWVRVALAGEHGVPADAVAIVATVTAINPSGANWVTVVPSSASVPDLLAQNRLVTVLNMTDPFQAVANLAQVKLGPDGLDLLSLAPCDMVLDVIGYYRPVAAAVRSGRYVGLAAARRALDTRDTFGFVAAGQTVEVDLTAFVPADASGVALNLTATECLAPGYFTAFPSTSTTVPRASSLNVNFAGETRAAAVIVPIRTATDGRRTIQVYALQPAKVIVDVTGYFTSESSPLSEVGLFVPVDPTRILDTRDPGQIGRLWSGWTVEGLVPGAGAASGSIVTNLTAVYSRGPGYLTICPARVPRPPTSNVNYALPLQVVCNHAISAVTTGYGFQVFSEGGAHVVVDYMGYYSGTPAVAQIPLPENLPPPPIGPEWTLSVPALGLVSRVRAGDSQRITDSGDSWHWTGTGHMGQDAHVASFAHRTTHGGPYRYLHFLNGGDEFTLTTADRREYTYQVVRRDLTNGNVTNILNATRFHPGTTYSLIACTKTDFTPTSTAWRIIVTGALIGWREL